MKIILTLLALLCTKLCVAQIDLEQVLKKIANARLDITIFEIAEHVQQYGYDIKTHTVTTEDGYILELHQLYKGDDSSLGDKPPVLLMHDLLGTSAVFVMLGTEESLAFQLVDAGYDVWLGNNRGNTYCQTHTTLTVYNDSFWDFSLNELGVYDAPVIIDHMLNQSNSDKVSVVGHGQGAAQFLVLTSMLNEYNDKINELVALAPLAYVSRSTHPLAMILRGHDDLFEGLGVYLNVTDLLDHYDLVNTVAGGLCVGQYATLCEGILFLIGGFDVGGLQKSDLVPILQVMPGGVSLKEVVYYIQLLKSGNFCPFDLGKIGNFEKYGSINPPSYNLTQVTAPVDIFYSENDLWVNTKDIEQLAGEIEDSKLHLVGYKYFSHLDYIIGKDASSLVFFDLINVLNDKNGLDAITSTAAPTTEETTTTTRRPRTAGTTLTGQSSEDTKATGKPDGNASTDKPETSTSEGSVNAIKFSLLALATFVSILTL